MKSHTEMIEGPEAWTRFESAVKKILSVPRYVIQERIQQHRAEAEKNPHKRGPKGKVKPSASSDLAV